MRIPRSHRTNFGLTLLEAVVIIFSLSLLFLLLLPALGAAARKKNLIGCTDHLKQMGLAFRVWEGDHDDKYPMSVSSTNGGAMEIAAQGNAEVIFQAMSNALTSSKILVCPADIGRWPAPNFNRPLKSSNLSYFVNVEAKESNPQDVMMGDDNFEIRGLPVKSGLLVISATNAVAWSADRHQFRGNLWMADGSVQGINQTGLAGHLCSANAGAIRLAIP